MGHNIQHSKGFKQGEFYVLKNGEKQASLSYSTVEDNKIIIEKTEVREPLREEGIGHQLMNEAIEYARNNKSKIIPLCAFAKAVFEERKDELDDVRAKS